MNAKVLSEKAGAWLETRGIWDDTAVRFGVYTANLTNMRGATVVVFPFMEGEVIVNEKFRQLPKEKFWQHKGRKKIFWNVDALDDPSLETGDMPLIITEGELDALSAIQCGFPLTVSVPDGAPPEGSMSGRSESNGDAEQTGKFEFLWEAREKLRKVKRFVIAVDNDGPGRSLAEHLVRRLSAAKCSFVEYPPGCKDLNDVLVQRGPEAVTTVLNSAKQYPVRGLYRLSDYPEASFDTLNTGWSSLDRHLKLFAGEFMVVTGIPSHGKTSWVLNLLANMSNVHGLRSVIFSPEMSVVPSIRDRFRCIKANKHISAAAEPHIDAWIEDSFVFIGPDPTRRGGDDDDYNLDWIIDRAEDAVLRDGVRILLIDPWNEVEHAVQRGVSTTEYVGQSIRKLRQFAKLYSMIVIVVAHPTKLHKRSEHGGYAEPSLYDISDSAHWYNKADHGVVVYRDDSNISSIWVVKSRFEEAGERGRVKMRFDQITRRFEMLAPDPEPAAGDGLDPSPKRRKA